MTPFVLDAKSGGRPVTTAAGNATPAAGDGEISYAYDARNTLTEIDHSDATPDVGFTYTYDEADTPLLSQMSDGAGTETYGYDALDRLTSVSRGGAGFSYAYDGASNITRRTYPDATVVDLTYDDDGRTQTVVSGGQTTAYAYDAASNPIAVTNANATATARTFDRAGRLSSITHTGPAACKKVDDAGCPTNPLPREISSSRPTGRSSASG